MISIRNSSKEIKEISAMIKECFLEQQYSPKGKVFVKPNLSGRQPITEGENTTVYFMDALLSVLREAKCEVIIGHSGLLGTQDRVYPFEKIIIESGFSKYKRFKNVQLCNLDIEKRKLVNVEGFDFEIPKIIEECDSYINLAKMKTHMEAVITFSLKNQMGILPETGRIKMHKEELEVLIGRLGVAAIPTISIIEAIVCMQGNGPHHGEDVEINKIFVGKNMVELDSVVSALIDIDPLKVPQLIEAQRLSVGKIPGKSELIKYSKYKFIFKKASTVEKYTPKIYAWPTTSCSRCITALNESGKLMKKSPKGLLNLLAAGYFGKTKHIVIGKGAGVKVKKNDTIICVGTCALGYSKKHNVDCLAKCPPSVEETYEYLLKNFNK